MLAGMNGSGGPPPATKSIDEITERLRRLEAQMTALTDAVEVLARGLESSPMAEPPDGHIEEAARRAHELLLLAKSVRPPGAPGQGGTSG